MNTVKKRTIEDSSPFFLFWKKRGNVSFLKIERVVFEKGAFRRICRKNRTKMSNPGAFLNIGAKTTKMGRLLPKIRKWGDFQVINAENGGKLGILGIPGGKRQKIKNLGGNIKFSKVKFIFH